MSYSDTTYSKKPSGIYVPEIVRLQEETNDFTKMLEHEKRQLMVLEDQIKQEMAEIKSIKPSKEEQKKRNAAIASLEKTIRTEELKLNETNAKNEELKREIDVHRKEIKSTDKQIKKYNKNIKNNMKTAKQKNEEFVECKKKAEETFSQIKALEAKHEEEKERFEKEIRNLQQRLNEKDKSEEAKDKTKTSTTDHKFVPETAAAGNKTEFSNPISILKMRLNKLVSTNKVKKGLVDRYISNVKLIEDSFNQIKESTGISSIDEIVTTFIKAEEQNYSLFNYVNRLNQETDQLQDANNKIKKDIELFRKSEAEEEMDREKYIEHMQEERSDKKKEIEGANASKDRFKEELKEIQKDVEKMIKLFKQSKFALSVANEMSYEEGTTFNDTNVVQYLAELEEYIASLITYVAFRNDEPYAAIAAIPLSTLDEKVPNKARIPQDIAKAEEKMRISEIQEGEDKGIVSAHELYQKYINFVKSQDLVKNYN